MVTANDINPNELIKELANRLKGTPEIKPPVWTKFAKTGRYKERPPASSDWWHTRAAAVLRTVDRLGPIGTSKLRTRYGGKKNRGVASEHTYKGSGSIIRSILQQLEKAGLVIQASKGFHKGRVTTSKGKSLLNKIAKDINPEKIAIKKEEKAIEPKPETKKTRKKVK